MKVKGLLVIIGLKFIKERKMKRVDVVFDDYSKAYSYVLRYGTAKEGDFFLVMTPSGWPKVVRVVDVFEEVPPVATRCLLNKIHLEGMQLQDETYQKEVAIYQEAKRKLKIKAKEFEKRSLLEALAKKDKEAASLLKLLDYYDRGTPDDL